MSTTETKRCGLCGWWVSHGAEFRTGACTALILLPASVLSINRVSMLPSEGTDCLTFARKEAINADPA